MPAAIDGWHIDIPVAEGGSAPLPRIAISAGTHAIGGVCWGSWGSVSAEMRLDVNPDHVYVLKCLYEHEFLTRAHVTVVLEDEQSPGVTLATAAGIPMSGGPTSTVIFVPRGHR